ncbi:MAG: thiosulfate sulfurtransferase [Candidatus Syntrophoarchaeum sp. GoM_oil]|nr:MAG: thiosulfate sulfurtransferase [Candidatus Syntrophoarchaeum sp. GoM_oil]
MKISGLFLVFISIILSLQIASATGFITITPEEAEDLIASEDPVIFDIRTLEEYNAGHIEDAVPVEDLEDVFPYQGRTVLIYDSDGSETEEFCGTLVQVSMQGLKFSSIYCVDGGWKAWSGADIDTPTPEKEIPEPPLPSFTTASPTSTLSETATQSISPTATSLPTDQPEPVSSTPVATEDASGFGLIGALIGGIIVCILTITRRRFR